MQSSAVQMAHRVPVGTMTGRERFALRTRLERGGRLALAERLARYVGPSCAGCGRQAGADLALVTVSGGVWRLCGYCRDEFARWSSL